MADLRTLGPGDEPALAAFLARHADSSMFLRSNSRAAGLVDGGCTYEGTYVAAWAGGAIAAVAAHYWNSWLVVQAPVATVAVARAAAARSGRPLRGINGPFAQVAAACAGLGLADLPRELDDREDLYALDLADLVVPPALATGAVICRPPRADEVELLAGWRAEYCVEALGQPDSAALRADCRAAIELYRATGIAFVLEQDRSAVAYSMFNARLPDTVQVGGVWTPPTARGRGLARCVVAGSLLAARAEGAARATLVTGEDNQPARRAYLALGFRVVGDYGLVGFAAPHPSVSE